MTKQQRSATARPLSRLCRFLLLALLAKLAVLGFMLAGPDAFQGPWDSLLSSGTAHAADPGAAAPPVIPPAGAPENPAPPARNMEDGLPDAGKSMSGDTAQTQPASSGAGNSSALPALTPPAQGGALPTDGVTREALVRRQEELNRREAELRRLEQEINGKLEKMQILQNRLDTMIKDAEQAKDAKFKHLVEVLSNMKPKNAAAVLEDLDPRVSVRLLAEMRGKQAGEILTFVKPEIAAKLTEALARIQLPIQ